MAIWRTPRSLFARITALSVLIALMATALLYVAARWVVTDQSDATLSRIVDTDLAGLVDIHASGGTAELRKRLDDRLALAAESQDPAHYLLADLAGKRLAGDIARWPDLAAENSQAGYVRLAGGPEVFARATLLDPQTKLLVAREYGERDALLLRIGAAFAAAGSLIIVLTVAAGLSATMTLRRRVRAANAALQGGAINAYPKADSNERDELEMLSQHVHRVIMRQAELIEAHRTVSDQTAHELRTPLMHLDMQLLAAIDRALDPALLELLARARKQIRVIIRLLESLLDIAANEARRGDSRNMESTNLSDMAHSLADLFADSAADLGLSLRCDITADVVIECDVMQMNRLLSNLLDNALKYVPAGGTVVLSVRPGPVITVSDDGPGIPPDQRTAIFERFQRGRSQRAEGHGLGLALVRAIAERHGLRVRCEDAGPGAIFIISREDA